MTSWRKSQYNWSAVHSQCLFIKKWNFILNLHACYKVSDPFWSRGTAQRSVMTPNVRQLTGNHMQHKSQGEDRFTCMWTYCWKTNKKFKRAAHCAQTQHIAECLLQQPPNRKQRLINFGRQCQAPLWINLGAPFNLVADNGGCLVGRCSRNSTRLPLKFRAKQAWVMFAKIDRILLKSNWFGRKIIVIEWLY